MCLVRIRNIVLNAFITVHFSPSEGPCCTKQCRLIDDASFVCRDESDCEQMSTCRGNTFGAICPASAPKPNMTYCNDFTQVCVNGVRNRVPARPDKRPDFTQHKKTVF